MSHKIPDFILVKELLKEKERWEIERKALREIVEKKHAEIVRLKRNGVAHLFSEIDAETRRECRREALYKELNRDNVALRRKNKELNDRNKQLAVALFKEKQKNET